MSEYPGGGYGFHRFGADADRTVRLVGERVGHPSVDWFVDHSVVVPVIHDHRTGGSG